jgi:polar amino acid transport system permease protein
MSEALSLLLSHYDLLAVGLLITLVVSAGAIALGVLLGALLAWAASKRHFVIHVAARMIIETMRALPFLLVLLLVHFSAQTLLGRIPGTITGTAALAVYGAAYFAEAFRAARTSVPEGQTEAAYALGFRPSSAFFKVIVTQMMVVFVPIARVVAVMLMKESAVLSVITVPELTHAAMRIQSISFATVPTFILVTLCYWAAVSLLSWCSGRLERRLEPTFRLTAKLAHKALQPDGILLPQAPPS